MNNKTIRIKTILMAIGLSSLLVGCSIGSGGSFGDNSHSDVVDDLNSTNKGLVIKYVKDSNIVTHNYLIDTKCSDGQEYLNSSTANYIEYEKEVNIGKQDAFNGTACIDGSSLKIKYSYSNKNINNEDSILHEKSNLKYGETTLSLLESKEIKEPGFDGSILLSWYGESGGKISKTTFDAPINIIKKEVNSIIETQETKIKSVAVEQEVKAKTVEKEIIEVKKSNIDPEIEKLQKELEELNKQISKPIEEVKPVAQEKVTIETPKKVSETIVIEPAIFEKKEEVKKEIKATKEEVKVVKEEIKKEKPMIVIKSDEERPADEKVSISQTSSVIKMDVEENTKQVDEYVDQSNNWIISEDDLINEEGSTTKKPIAPKSENIKAKIKVDETPKDVMEVKEVEIEKEVKEESKSFEDF